MKLVHSLSGETDPVLQGEIYCVSPTGPSAVVSEIGTSCPVPGAAVFQARLPLIHVGGRAESHLLGLHPEPNLPGDDR